MPRRIGTLELMLPLRGRTLTAHAWLCAALRSEILDGRLRAGARLPSTRDLAHQYSLSRGTIVTAFDQLEAEGYLTSRIGSGTYVSDVRPEELLHAPATTTMAIAARGASRRRWSAAARRTRAFPSSNPKRPRAFRTNVPALDLFPTTVWGQLAARRCRRASTALLHGCGPMGYAPLQDAVAAYLTASRGVVCRPEQVAVMSGAQEALDLITRLFVDPGDPVCIEDPGYIGAEIVFAAAGARVVRVGVDEEGMRTPGRACVGARLAYVTPAHQFPLGVSMSLARRLALLDWARREGALIVEDDYDSEYRYAGRPVPALQGLDRHGCVLFAGTFSKVLFPSIRLGYLVVPPDLVDRVAAIKSMASRHAPVLEQAVLADFMAEGHFGRHVRRMREVYAERREVLLSSARERLDGLLEVTGVEAGLQTAAWLTVSVDAEAIAEAAAARDVDVTPLGRYFHRKPARDGLQLGFAAVDVAEIRRGVRDLAIVLDGLRRRSKNDRGAR